MGVNLMTRCTSIVGTAIAAFVLAGCGGSESKTYTLEESQGCLSRLGRITAKEDMNDLAFDAWQAVGVAVGEGSNVEVGFERTENDAKRNESRMKLVASAILDNAPVDDVLMRQGNVVLAWDNAPTSAQLASVKDCLS